MTILDSQNLLKACADNNLDLVHVIINNCQNVNFDWGSYSCLHYACKNGNLEIIELLIKKGASINKETHYCWGESIEGFHTFDPILIACIYGHLNIVKLLRHYGAEINHKYSECIRNRSTSDIFRNFFNKTEPKKFEAIPLSLSLLYACKSGNIKLVEYLIKNGAKCENQSGKDLLMFYACKYGNSELIMLLLNYGATFNNDYSIRCVEENHEKTSLHYLIKTNKISVLKSLVCNNVNIFEYDKYDKCFIEIACEYSNAEVVKFLNRIGYDINIMFTNGNYPIHVACKRFYKELIKVLIALGAKVNRKTSFGETPLHISSGIIPYQKKTDHYSSGDNLLIIDLLIDTDIDINEVDESGNSALHLSCEGFNIDTIKILTDKGANVNAKNNVGKSPLHISCFKQPFDRANVKENKWDTYYHVENFSIIKFLIEKGANVNEVDNDGNTPLHIACKSSDEKIVNFLLANHAYVNSVNENGNTPLHEVCSMISDKWELAKSLILYGANLDLKNNQGDTPLHLACSNCDIILHGGCGLHLHPTFETIKLLLNNKSNPSERNSKGETSLKIAYQRRLDTYDIDQFKFMYDFRCKKNEELNLLDVSDYDKCTDLESSWNELADDEIRSMDEDFSDWRSNID